MVVFMARIISSESRNEVFINMSLVRKKKISLEVVKDHLLHFFRDRKEVLLVYLFGSCLRENIDRAHDIDIAILVDPVIFKRLDKEKPYGYEAELIAELIRLLKYNEVDLVLLNKASPLLAYEVIHHGKLLSCPSEEVRVQFEISSLKRHADTKYLRSIKRFYSELRAEKGLSAYV